MDIKKLTEEEIQTLQVDAALRLMGEYSSQLIEINELMVQLLKDKLSAESKLVELKQTKSTLTNCIRVMQSIAKNS